jgi:hypothetical protein
MAWLDHLLNQLGRWTAVPYHADGPPATEPTALAALALVGHARPDRARPLLHWLADVQQASGRLGTTADADSPGWPTSLALLAWLAAAHSARRFGTVAWSPEDLDRWQHASLRATTWILGTQGETLQHADFLGHDTTLVGWPWVDGTHSWVEPTGLHVLALKAAGHGQHPRTREGVRMLVDRQLPAGGCNCGNTIVLDMPLRPHLQPTGIAMLGLAGETDGARRVRKSLDYLLRNVGPRTAAASLCWALLGLAAHGISVASAGAWLESAAIRPTLKTGSPHREALLALAAIGATGPLFPHLSRNQA